MRRILFSAGLLVLCASDTTPAQWLTASAGGTSVIWMSMTFDDPKMSTRPFTVRIPHHLMADDDIFEMFPQNEKDCGRMAKK